MTPAQERAALQAAGIAPVPFVDPRRCDGIRSPISLKPREVCTLCPLRIEPLPKSVQWIEPLAAVDADGVWTCATREALHAAHRPTLAALATPLDLGKVGTTAGAVSASIGTGGASA